MTAILIAIIVVLTIVVIGAGAWWALRRKSSVFSSKGEFCHVTANVNAVQTPLEFLDPSVGLDYNQAMAILYEVLYGQNIGALTLKEALGDDSVGCMGSAIEKNAPAALERFTELTNRNVSDILNDKYMGDARLYSMADRLAKGTANAPRPSPIAGWSPSKLKNMTLSNWLDEWLNFMHANASQAEEFPGKPLSDAAAMALGNKYPKITPEDLKIFGQLEYVYLLVCDAIAVKAFMEADDKTGGGLSNYLARNTRERREHEIADLVVSTAAKNSSMSLQEVSNSLLLKIMALIGARKLNHKLIVQKSREWNNDREQNSVVILNQQSFKYTPELEIGLAGLEKRLNEIEGVANGDVCISGGYVGKHMTIVASFHGDSDGKSAGKFVKALFNDEYVLKNAPVIILGIDANTSEKSLAGFRNSVTQLNEKIRGEFCQVGDCSGAPSLWGSFTETGNLPTTGSARTPMQAQFHKAAKQVPGDLMRGKFNVGKKDPKDFIIISFPAISLGAVSPATVSIRNGANFVSPREFTERLMPNRDLPTDHAMVRACIYTWPNQI